MNRWTVDVHTDPITGEAFIELPDELAAQANLNPGDNIKWEDNGDGSFTLSKKEDTKYVLVETLVQYRMRYLVEVPTDHPEWALDTVTCEQAREFSQECLGETIFSHRDISEADALDLCRKDNGYLSSWSDVKLKQTFFTMLDEGNEEA